MAKKLVRYKNVNGALVKQYEYPALIDGFVDISQMPIVGAMGSAVIESGENANGRWVKWADGTIQMACSFRAMGIYNNAPAVGTATFTFPAAAVSVDLAIPTTKGGYSNLRYGSIESLTLSNAVVLITNLAPQSFATTLIQCGLFVVGRWK